MFYDRFHELVVRNGLSDSSAAQSVGLHKSIVGKWKNGATPNGTIIAELSKLLGVTTDYLLGMSESTVNEMSSEFHERPDYVFIGDLSEKDRKEVIAIIEMKRGIRIE